MCLAMVQTLPYHLVTTIAFASSLVTSIEEKALSVHVTASSWSAITTEPLPSWLASPEPLGPHLPPLATLASE